MVSVNTREGEPPMKPYLLLATFFLPLFPANPQQPLVGSIQGVIRDQRGAPLPDATLSRTNIDAVEPENHRQTTGSDEHGIFQFVDVPPGRYSIAIQRQGYRDYSIPAVNVRPGESVKLPDIKMLPLRSGG